MRVLLSMYGSRGEVKPTAVLPVQSPGRCAPPDFAELLALIGVPLVSIEVWR